MIVKIRKQGKRNKKIFWGERKKNRGFDKFKRLFGNFITLNPLV